MPRHFEPGQQLRPAIAECPYRRSKKKRSRPASRRIHPPHRLEAEAPATACKPVTVAITSTGKISQERGRIVPPTIGVCSPIKTLSTPCYRTAREIIVGVARLKTDPTHAPGPAVERCLPPLDLLVRAFGAFGGMLASAGVLAAGQLMTGSTPQEEGVVLSRSDSSGARSIRSRIHR